MMTIHQTTHFLTAQNHDQGPRFWRNFRHFPYLESLVPRQIHQEKVSVEKHIDTIWQHLLQKLNQEILGKIGPARLVLVRFSARCCLPDDSCQNMSFDKFSQIPEVLKTRCVTELLPDPPKELEKKL